MKEILQTLWGAFVVLSLVAIMALKCETDRMKEERTRAWLTPTLRTPPKQEQPEKLRKPPGPRPRFEWSRVTMPGQGYTGGLTFPPGLDVDSPSAVAPMPREKPPVP